VASSFLSVIVPAHNAAPYLGAALESVLSEGRRLGAGRLLEVIVVDDASRDQTVAVARSYESRHVRLVSRQVQGGPGAARNSGIAAGSGEFLGFVDADDLWTAGRLDPMLAALNDTTRHIVFGHLRQFACPRMDPELLGRLHVPAAPMPGYCAGGMLIRRADFESIGRFAEAAKVGEFIDWFGRARDAGFSPVLIGEVVLERRIHGANQTVQHQQVFRDYAHILKRTLDRRRPREAS